LTTTLLAVASLLIAASCSLLPADDDAGPDASPAAQAVDGPTTTQPPSTTSTTMQDSGPTAGGFEVGDPLFPGLGNTGYDVAHYDIAIDLSGDEFRAEANLELVPDVRLTSFNLDLVGTTVDRVFIDGVEAGFERNGRELTITPSSLLASDRTVAVKVEYRGTPEPIADSAGPIALGWHTEEWGTYVASEPSGAATWFPANDHPSDKATFTFRITVPEGQAAAGPGILISETTTATRTTYVWASADPMATYLASIVTGDFAIVTSQEADGPVIRNVLPTERANQLLPALASTGEMLDVFESLFGPYPFESYGVVAIPEPLSFALENQTLSLFDAEFLTLRRRTVENVLAHELAHQWFGNHVSPATWADIWLNEGFASWADHYWTERDGGTTFDQRAEQAAVLELRPPTSVTPATMFDATVYLRGALTLEALRRQIGDDPFFDLLKAWSTTYGGGTASTDDFLELVRIREGAEAETTVDRWLFDPVMPDLAPAS
jgi:aminopeptidase N